MIDMNTRTFKTDNHRVMLKLYKTDWTFSWQLLIGIQLKLKNVVFHLLLAEIIHVECIVSCEIEMPQLAVFVIYDMSERIKQEPPEGQMFVRFMICEEPVVFV